MVLFFSVPGYGMCGLLCEVAVLGMGPAWWFWGPTLRLWSWGWLFVWPVPEM